jgi:hypothetical protein
VIELKNLFQNKLKYEDTFDEILKFRKNTMISDSPPDMNRYEQESSLKFFLKKLLDFLKNISFDRRKRNSVKIKFKEIPAALTIAFCIMPYTMARFYISINFRNKDATIWSFLQSKIFHSNNRTHNILIPDSVIDELTPLLFEKKKPIMLIFDTHFFKIARTFSDFSLLYILRHGVGICLKELLNIDMESLFPKQSYIFSFHEYLYEPYFLKSSRMSLERGAIQQHPRLKPQDFRDHAFASMFTQ